MTTALIIAALVGLLGIAGMVIRLQAVGTQLAAAQSALADAKKMVSVTSATATIDKGRLENVITSLKAQIAELERGLDDHSTPEMVRARLRGLLG